MTAKPMTQKPFSEDIKAVQKAYSFIENGKYTQARILLLGLGNHAKNPDALFALGDVHFRTNDLIKAAAYYMGAANINKDPAAYRMAGISLSKVEDYANALRCLDNPACRTAFIDDADYREALMLSLIKTNNPQPAIALYESRSDNDILHTTQYIDALILTQKLDAAHGTAEQAVKDYPGRPESWSVLERAYTALRQFDKAVDASLKATRLDPESAVYQCNLGLCYLYLARIDDALAAFDRATEIDPLLMAAYLNRSTVLRYKREFKHLAADLDKAYEIDPASADVHYAIGVNAMRQDDYEKAFSEVEWYWHKNLLTSHRMPVSMPRWYGGDLTGKTLLFFADQGIGDIIMMMRYIPDIVEQYNPAKIYIHVNAKMAAMFTTSFPGLFAAGRLEIFDETLAGQYIHCIVAATSLPHVMGTTVHNVPHPDAYLKKDKTLDYKTGTDKEFVIGISWFTKSLDAGYIRSLKLMDFDFLAKYKNIRVIDLQYGDTSAERAEAARQGFEVYHDDTVDSWVAMQPFMDQLAACDLVISIDNTTVHAAGALGVPCWTILSQSPYWRWPTDGNATPWYHSLRLFRQTNKDYASLIAEVDAAFQKFLNGDRSVLSVPPYRSGFVDQARDRKKAVLINDTNACYSWGNFAAMEGIKSGLRTKNYDVTGISVLELPWFPPHLPGLQDFDDWKYLAACRYRDPTLFYRIEHADEVIINGEGMMNGLGENALRLLYLAYVAKHFYKRRVSIINHSCYPEDRPGLSDPQKLAFYYKVYSILDACVVRDQVSYDLLRSINLPVTMAADTALLWLKDYMDGHESPAPSETAVITVGPGYDTRAAGLFAALCTALRQNGIRPLVLSGAKWHVAQEDHALARDLADLMDEPVDIVKAANVDQFMTHLCAARMVITGFEQVCMMAHALSIPTIPLTTGTNALTIFGLSKMAGLPEPLFYEDTAIIKKLEAAIAHALESPLKTPEQKAKNLNQWAISSAKNMAPF